LNTPVLLMASGIGPQDHLTEMGIAITVDAPDVGQHLRNHPALVQQYDCSGPVTAYSYLSPLAGAKALLDYALRRPGHWRRAFPR